MTVNTIEKLLDLCLTDRDKLLQARSNAIFTALERNDIYFAPLGDGYIEIGYDEYGHLACYCYQYEDLDNCTSYKYRAHWYPNITKEV